MFPDPKLIKGYFVYEYTFLDDLSFIATPAEFFGSRMFADYSADQIDTVVHEVKEKFLEAGWEGDGSIGIIWLPPFVDTGTEDTWGNYLWHVKQSNNGISFILSEQPLEFERIKAQNDELPLYKGRGIPVSIIDPDLKNLRSATERISSELKRHLASVRTLTDPGVMGSITNDLLIHSQGILVRCLHEFLDDCYLRFLIEAINGNRSKIKIRKSRVKLNPDSYIPDESEDEGSNTWFTLQGIVSDMWKAYKFEPYKAKVEMLFKAVDFNWDPDFVAFLNKHVTLRNCVHHHEGQLDNGSLQDCGVSQFAIKGPSSNLILKAWSMVTFTHEELEEFCTVLVGLANDFGTHVWVRVPTRYYVVNPTSNMAFAHTDKGKSGAE